MNKKLIYLFLALILPGLIFVFLKRFGKNEFAIPLYYQQGVDSLNALCGTNYQQPYHVPDSVLRKTGLLAGRPSLFLFSNQIRDNPEFKRISGNFEAEEFQVAEVDSIKLGAVTFKRWCSCVFMVKAPWNVVLMDSQKRIRGYYALGSREEVDRLIMEMQILLKKY